MRTPYFASFCHGRPMGATALAVLTLLVLIACAASAPAGERSTHTGRFRAPSDSGLIRTAEPRFQQPALVAVDGEDFERPVRQIDHETAGNSQRDDVPVRLARDPFEMEPNVRFVMTSSLAQSGDTEQEKVPGSWTSKPIDDLGTSISLPSGPVPEDKAAERTDLHCPEYYCGCCDRGWCQRSYCYAATCLCYRPLYFEETNLERYGYGCPHCSQMGVSAAHFFATVPLLPYKMATDCPWDCHYTLGHYRPGTCGVPWRTNCVPLNRRGALGQAGAVVGLVFLLP